jgi:hypothetical protein
MPIQHDWHLDEAFEFERLKDDNTMMGLNHFAEYIVAYGLFVPQLKGWEVMRLYHTGIFKFLESFDGGSNLASTQEILRGDSYSRV